MKYGNCLIGACVLLFKRKTKKPKIILRFRPESCVPHFMVKTINRLYHYKLEKNILPWPFCYLIFQGSFQPLNLEKEILFINQKNAMKWIFSLSFILGIIFCIFINK